MTTTRRNIFKNILDRYDEPNLPKEKRDFAYEYVKSHRSEQRISDTSFDSFGFKLLHWACLYGQTNEALRLIKLPQTRVNETNKELGNFRLENATPLYLAAENGIDDIVELLLDANADILTQPLVMEYNHGYMSSYKFPVKSPNPLDIAIENKHTNVVNLLLLPTIKKQLENYIEQRDNEGEYSFCLFRFGFNKADKILASEAFKYLLESPASKTHLNEFAKNNPAISDARLGNIFKKYMNNYIEPEVDNNLEMTM